MAGKQILGDDPFAGEAPPPPAAVEGAPKKDGAEVASDVEAKDPAAKDAAKEVASAAAAQASATKTVARSTTKSVASSVTKTVAEPTEAKAEAKPVRAERRAAKSKTDSIPAQTEANSDSAATAASTETYTPVTPPPPSEYGPSIDRAPPMGHRHGLVEEVRQIEKSMRDRLLPTRTGEHGGERQHLPLEFVWQRWRKLAMRDRSDVVDEFGRDPRVAARVDPVLEFLYKTYFRVETRGMGHIPDAGRGLIVANHSGTLPYDGAMIMHAVRTEHRSRREVRPLVEDFVFHFPYLGTLMNRIGGVRACPENAERLLTQDQLVAVFPEGIKGIGKLFKERYQLQRFGRGGFIKLALKSDAPIIPTAVVGAEEIHPMVGKITWLAKSFGIPYIPVTPTFPFLGPLGMVPLPTKWFLVFGEPLYFNTEYGPDGANDRILVNKLAEQVRVRIQEMIDGVLKQRRSILFG
jgi:1-acyl-sn-glycerol-3-phosphate acyltransferase